MTSTVSVLVSRSGVSFNDAMLTAGTTSSQTVCQMPEIAVAGVQGVRMDLPLGMMFFGKTDQICDLYLFTFVYNCKSVVATKHLMHFAGDDS